MPFGPAGPAWRISMANFNQLYPMLRSLPTDELAEWLSLIDAMRATHGECVACWC